VVVKKSQRTHLYAVLAALAALALIVGATACGDGEKSSTAGSNTAGASAPSGDVPKPIAVDRTPTESFDPNVAPGRKPDLPARLAQTLPASGELFHNFDEYARQSASSRNVDYISAQANGDSTKQFEQVQSFLSRGIGALIFTPVDPEALVPLQREAIAQGSAVFSAPFAYSTTQGNIDQYASGQLQGEAAVRWIKENLDGKAEVVIFTQPQSPSIKPRDQAVRDALRAGGPGIRVVAESPMRELSADAGFRASNTILQQHPNVNAWIGPDGYLIGTMAALEAAGKAGDESGLFGISGDAEALDAIARGDGPFKSTVGFPSALWGYAAAQWAADWLEGKSIPLYVDFRNVALDSPEALAAFDKIQRDPATAFARNEKTHEYFTPYGNTSYEHNRYMSIVGSTS
jgi:ribose transport system substrate-binding protein